VNQPPRRRGVGGGGVGVGAVGPPAVGPPGRDDDAEAAEEAAAGEDPADELDVEDVAAEDVPAGRGGIEEDGSASPPATLSAAPEVRLPGYWLASLARSSGSTFGSRGRFAIACVLGLRPCLSL